MKKLILIADDDGKHLKLLTDVLQAEGHAVITAENGQRAIELARSTRPSLIVMDVQMPMLDGFSAIRALKAVPETRFIPAIVITALAMNGDRERLLADGFDGYLSKPISIKKLRVEVNRLLGGSLEPTDSKDESGNTA
jgi:CheY-like chemotaxis protein